MNLFVPGAFKINTVAKIFDFYFTSFCLKLLPSNETENRDCVWHMLDTPFLSDRSYVPRLNHIYRSEMTREKKQSKTNGLLSWQTNKRQLVSYDWLDSWQSCMPQYAATKRFFGLFGFFIRFVPLVVLVPLETCWSGNTTLLSTLLQIRLFTLSVGSFVRPSQVGDCRAPSIHSSTTNQPLQTFWPKKGKKKWR